MGSAGPKVQVGNAVNEILRHYSIGDFQSEAHQQNQNPAERRIQDIKAMTNAIMDRTGTPAQFWILATLYVIFLMNHICLSSLGDISPLHFVKGHAQDISALLHYRWWEPVYYLDDDGQFPSVSREKRGRWVGVAENVGDVLTYHVLTEDTGRVIQRSVLRSALDPENINYRAEFPTSPSASENKFVSSTSDIVVPGLDPNELVLPKFSPDELIGHTFIRTTDDGHG